ncbi:putative ribonuclease H-like domain-containing protein [Tanacetum coccineum]
MGHFARECIGPRNQDTRNKNQDSSRRNVHVEEPSSKAMLAIDGAGFDWSYMADDEVPLNMALMAFLDSEIYNDKTWLASVEEQLVFYKKNEVIFSDQIAVLKRDISFKDSDISKLKSEIEKLKQEKESNQLKIKKYDNASKCLDKLIGSQIIDNSRKGVGFVSYNVAPPPRIGLFSPSTIDLSNSGLEEFQQPEFEGYVPKTSKSVSENISNEVRESPDSLLVEELVLHDKNMAPRAVLMKTGLRPLNTARPVNTAHPKTIVYSARPMSHFSKSAQSTVKRPYQTRRALTNKKFNQKVNTTKEKLYTARPKGVNTARPNSAVVNAVRANKGHPQKKYQGYFDSGCSRHMTGNMSYLSDFKEFDGGYVTFLGGAKGGKNTSKGTLKTADQSQVLLKVPRKNNMYSVDMKNIVPKESLNCLVAKATLYESMLWHRRLAHVNFKSINKLVKENLVRGIKKEFSVARTPQQNGVVERRNRTLIEAARTMIADSKGRTPDLSFMRLFGCHVTILNTLDYLGKFDGKSDDGFFVGYSLNSKAFRVYNIRTRKVEKTYILGTNINNFVGTEESISVGHSSKETRSSQDYILMPLWKDGSLFDSSSKNTSNDEPQPFSDAREKDDGGVSKGSGIDDQEWPENRSQDINTAGLSINTAITNDNTDNSTLEAIHVDFFGDESEVDMSNIDTAYPVPSTPNTRIHKDHSLDYVIGDIQSGVQTRRTTKTIDEQGFISAVYEGETHEDLHTCLFAYFLSQEEPKRIAKALSDSAWVEVFKNKKDKRGIVIKNKARLVAQGYTQEEGIDYDEVFSPIARIKAIRLFLAYASFMVFMMYQMDVKSTFLYGRIEEEVYVCQPPGFEDPDYPDKVYKVVKALYGLHQAPRAWYETLAKYLLDNGFHRGKIDQTLFIKKQKGDILLVEVYVDDIIFGSIKKELCTEFEKLMHDNQDKYVADTLRKFSFTDVKTASTLMDTEKALLKDSDGDDVDVHLYKLMIGPLMYLTSSRPNIMLACKKQTVVATSSTKVEYVATASFYGQDKQGSIDGFGDTNCGVC